MIYFLKLLADNFVGLHELSKDDIFDFGIVRSTQTPKYKSETLTFKNISPHRLSGSSLRGHYVNLRKQLCILLEKKKLKHTSAVVLKISW